MPPRFATPEALRAQAERYFASCAASPLLDEDGTVLTNKKGEPLFYPEKPPTLTGLALALGFCSRRELLEFRARAPVLRELRRARLRLEAAAEERLLEGGAAAGARFCLANNFEGWAEKAEGQAGEDAQRPLAVTITVVEPEVAPKETGR